MITKNFLIKEYQGKRKSGYRIAKELGVKKYVIDNAITKWGIKRRSIIEATRPHQSLNIKGYKWCPMCKCDKIFSEFANNHRERFGKDSYCKKCSYIRAKRFYKNRNRKRQLIKAAIVKKFGNKCNKCKAENLPICCYQFHHQNGKKDFQISYNLLKKNITAELDKCIMVCANCHHIIHFGSFTLKNIN